MIMTQADGAMVHMGGLGVVRRTTAAQRRQSALAAQASRRALVTQNRAERQQRAAERKEARIAKRVGNKTVQIKPEEAAVLDQLKAKKSDLLKKIADAKAALALKKKQKGLHGLEGVEGLADEGDGSGATYEIITQPDGTKTAVSKKPPTATNFGTSLAPPSLLDLMAPKNFAKHLAAAKLNAKDTQYLFMKLSLETQQQTQDLLHEIMDLTQQLMDLLQQIQAVDTTAPTADGTTQPMIVGADGALYPAGGGYVPSYGGQPDISMYPAQYPQQVPLDPWAAQSAPQYQPPMYAQQPKYGPMVEPGGAYDDISPYPQQQMIMEPQAQQYPMQQIPTQTIVLDEGGPQVQTASVDDGSITFSPDTVDTSDLREDNSWAFANEG